MSAQIVAALESGPEKFRVIHLRTSHIGPETLLVAGEDRRARRADGRRTWRRASTPTEQRIRAAVPIAETIYLEPDIYHPDQADPPTRRSRSSSESRRSFRLRASRRS